MKYWAKYWVKFSIKSKIKQMDSVKHLQYIPRNMLTARALLCVALMSPW